MDKINFNSKLTLLKSITDKDLQSALNNLDNKPDNEYYRSTLTTNIIINEVIRIIKDFDLNF